MNKLLIISIILISFSCSATKEINKTVTLSNNQEILLGKVNKEGLSKNTYAKWFNTNYDNYTVKSEFVKKISPEMLKGVKTKLVMATWCGDSKREVPRFYKIIEALNYSEKKMQVISVDRSKKAVGFDLASMNITRVPTFIFYKENKEIGRITESPKTSLEEDLFVILSSVKN